MQTSPLFGRVPRERIAEEYQSADVFVLPSLAEGSGRALRGAGGELAGYYYARRRFGGAGMEGRIVPERDATMLADAVAELIENRGLRDRMAVAARERARDFTWEKYGERLVMALHSMA